jgi:CspA family cold shock protein
VAKGAIKRLIRDRMYGFIQTEEGKELFFHQNDLRGVNYSSLKEGQAVEFEVGSNRDGRPQAVQVKPAITT